MPLKPVLPTLFSSAGALILLTTPPRWRAKAAYRHTATVALGGTLMCLLILAVGPIAAGVYPYADVLPMAIRSLGLMWDGLALLCAILPVAGLLIQVVLGDTLGMTGPQGVARLVAVGALVAGCAAADLMTLCTCWAVMDMALLAADLGAATARDVSMATQRIWSRAGSLAAVVVATMLLTFEQGRTAWAFAGLDASVHALLMAAAWLRLGVFPLPGGEGVSATDRLIALASGGCIWLRVGSVAVLAQGGPLLMIILALGAVVLSVVALLAQEQARRLEAIHLHGLALMMLAPMMDSSAGPGVAALMMVGLGLVLVAQVGWQHRARLGLGRWELVPWMLVLACCGGVPLTVLGNARWLLLQRAALEGNRAIVTLAGSSCGLMTVACWRSLVRFRAEALESQADEALLEQPRWRAWTAWGVVAVCALELVGAGIAPPVIENVWRGGFPGIDIPPLMALFRGGGALSLVLVAAVILVPAAAIWIVEQRRGQGTFYRGPIRDALDRLISLDWLYVGLVQGLAVLQAGLRRGARVIESSFAMGWTVFWALVLLLYLTELV